MKTLFPVIALLLSAALSVPAGAQSGAPAKAERPIVIEPTEARAVTVNLTQFKVVKDERGAEKLVEAQSVRPNDVIEYRAVYKNVSTHPIKHLSANLPVPAGLEYLPVTAQPRKGVQFAPASGTFAAEPLQRRLPSGQTEPLPYNEYRQARWTIDELAPGASTTVMARVKVEAVTPLASASTATPAARP